MDPTTCPSEIHCGNRVSNPTTTHGYVNTTSQWPCLSIRKTCPANAGSRSQVSGAGTESGPGQVSATQVCRTVAVVQWLRSPTYPDCAAGMIRMRPGDRSLKRAQPFPTMIGQ